MSPHDHPPLAHVEAWVFDLDNTLYPASCNLFAQIDRRMTAFISGFLEVDETEARRIQKHYYREYGTTMRGLMTEHGMDPAAFLDFVHDIDHTSVEASVALDRALGALEGPKYVFTNGSERHAAAVLERRGIARHFDAVFDIAAAEFLPKPDPSVYRRMARAHGIEPKRAALFDDIARNLAPAAALGMTTVWVRHETDFGGRERDGPEGVDHVTDDLEGWLAGVVAARSALG